MQLDALPNRRLRLLVVPREHGAWGILLLPLVTGAWVGALRGGRLLPLIPLVLTALALFWIRTPVESWLGTSPMRVQNEAEGSALLRVIGALAAVSVLSLAGLFEGGKNRGLLLLGAAAGLAFVAQAALKKFGRGTRMAAQLVGSIGLTATAPAAYYVSTARLDTTAWGLWLANWLFAGDQIHFVQLRIHAARISGFRERLARGASFLAGQAALIAALLLAGRTRMLPLLALGAFLPVLIRGSAWFLEGPQPLAVRRLGWTELAHAVVFGILLVLGFQFG